MPTTTMTPIARKWHARLDSGVLTRGQVRTRSIGTPRWRIVTRSGEWLYTWEPWQRGAHQGPRGGRRPLLDLTKVA